MVGRRGQALQQAIQQRRGLARFQQALAAERAQIAAGSRAVLGRPAPADAGDPQRKLRDYVRDVDTLFATLERIAALPEDFQTAECAPLGQTLQQLATGLDARTRPWARPRMPTRNSTPSSCSSTERHAPARHPQKTAGLPGRFRLRASTPRWHGACIDVRWQDGRP